MSRLVLYAGIAGLALAGTATSVAHGAKSLNGFVGAQHGLTSAGAYTQPRDVAVYTGGDANPSNDKLLVVEGFSVRARVQRLGRHGNPELAWGGNVIAPTAPGNTGAAFEICDVTVSGASGCTAGVAGSDAGFMDDPQGIAVNQATGAVYVHDQDNRRILQFDIDGSFVRAWGWGVATGAGAFEICTTSCRKGIAGSGVGQLGESSETGTGIAVSPVAPFDVFVADPGNQRVLRFNANGTVDTNSFFGSSAEFSSGHPLRLAVDAAGVVYASDDTASSNRVVRYDTLSQSFLAPLGSALLGAGPTFGLEIDPTTGNLLVARDDPASPVVKDVDAPGSGAPSLADTHLLDTESPVTPPVLNGLGYDPVTGNVYLIGFLYAPPDGVFNGCTRDEPAPLLTCAGLLALADGSPPMGALVDAPLDVGSSSAVVSGSVDPAGGVAGYRFEISTDGQTWSAAAGRRYVAGDDLVEVSGELEGLEPNSFYRLRIRVSKQVGMDDIATVVSGEQVFLTDAVPPAVRTLGSSRRRTTSARLRATVDPQGAATTYRFEYGPAGGSFDHHVPSSATSAGSGNDPQLVIHDLSGLQPDTAYHFRIVASNFAGTSVGDPVVFRTSASDTALPPLDERRIELVSTSKIGGQGVGDWYQGIGSQTKAGVAAYRGDRFAVLGTLGTVLVDSAYAYATDWALTQRTPEGWISKPVMNRVAHGRQKARYLSMGATDEELCTTTWTSNGGLLRLFEEMIEWPDAAAAHFARDCDGRWEVFGPLEPDHKGPGFEAHTIAEGRSMVAGVSPLRGLTGAGDPALAAVANARNVYEFDFEGGLSDTFPGIGVRRVANVCTDGTVVPERLATGKLADRLCESPPSGLDATLIDPRGASIGGMDDDTVRRALSVTGARLFFMAPDPAILGVVEQPCSGSGVGTACPPQLYVRQRLEDGSSTVRWIGRSQIPDQDASLLAAVTFEGASRDGDKVLFRTATPLTADDPNGESSPTPGGVKTGKANPLSTDLFLYDFPDDPSADPADGELTRLSGGPEGLGDPNVVPGVTADRPGGVRFVSDDGMRVYFATAAEVPGVAQADSDTITEAGGTASSTDAANLYLYDASQAEFGDRWRFVVRLPRASALGRCATENASGEIFDSTLQGDLTLGSSGRCVRGTADGTFVTFWTDGRLIVEDPDAVSGDVYGYDAVDEELVRLSAPQGGAGGSYECASGSTSARCYGDPGFGSSALPSLGLATRPNIEGDRLVFFQSGSRLVPDDIDAKHDVYQWHNGELTLVSTGDSETDGAFYHGNDESGQDVFFSTLDRLTWQDKDAVMDVYVARVGGGIPEPTPAPSCDAPGGACQGPGAGSPLDADPGSSVPGGGDAVARPRVHLSVGRLSARARRRAARRGVIVLPLRASHGGVVKVRARARVSRRLASVGQDSVRLAGAGRAVARVRLASSVRRALRRGRRVTVVLSVRMKGAQPQTSRVSLSRRGRR